VIPLAWLGAPLAGYIVGKQFLAGIQVFRFLMVAQVLLTITNPIQFLLYGMGRVKLCTACDCLIAVSFWLTGIASVRLWGAPGLAFALLVCQSLAKIAFVGFVLKLVFSSIETGQRAGNMFAWSTNPTYSSSAQEPVQLPLTCIPAPGSPTPRALQ
jgi:O-antigen/teichoic acid export membrane protein